MISGLVRKYRNGLGFVILKSYATALPASRQIALTRPLRELAAKTSHSECYIRTRAQLAFLSPAIQKAILDGRQPPELTLKQTIRKPIPLDCGVQARIYGRRQCQLGGV